MKCVIVYVVTEIARVEGNVIDRHQYVRGDRQAHGGAYVRVEIVEADELITALDHAKPLPGESVSNAHPFV